MTLRFPLLLLSFAMSLLLSTLLWLLLAMLRVALQLPLQPTVLEIFTRNVLPLVLFALLGSVDVWRGFDNLSQSRDTSTAPLMACYRGQTPETQKKAHLSALHG